MRIVDKELDMMDGYEFMKVINGCSTDNDIDQVYILVSFKNSHILITGGTFYRNFINHTFEISLRYEYICCNFGLYSCFDFIIEKGSCRVVYRSKEIEHSAYSLSVLFLRNSDNVLLPEPLSP